MKIEDFSISQKTYSNNTVFTLKADKQIKFYCPLLTEVGEMGGNKYVNLLTAILDKENIGIIYQLKIKIKGNQPSLVKISQLINKRSLKPPYSRGLTPMTSFINPQNNNINVIVALWCKSNTNLRYKIDSGYLCLSEKKLIVRNVFFDGMSDDDKMIRSISKVLVINQNIHVWFALSKNQDTFINPNGNIVQEYDYYKGVIRPIDNNMFEVSKINICKGVKEQFTDSVGVGRSEIIYDNQKGIFIGFFSIRKASGYYPLVILESLDGIIWSKSSLKKFPDYLTNFIFISKFKNFWTGNTEISGNSKLEIICDSCS